MKIRSVTAHAFGPFRGETLELAPRLTVVHGPNESGKSSWHAAIFGGLCGMRKSRGRPRADDQVFIDRHKPWRSGSWKVTVTLELADGSVVRIDQDLGNKESSAVRDGTNERLTNILRNEDCVDGAILLGLSRNTVPATHFVRQADILRVTQNADELQEYLERAAATSSVDTTAESALEHLATFHRSRVGSTRKNATGPLATALSDLQIARQEEDAAQEQLEECNRLLSETHQRELEKRDLEEKADALRRHEHMRERVERWRAIHDLERRISRARELSTQLEQENPADLAPPELLDRATRALVTFDERPSVPPSEDGPSADELAAQLEELPAPPDGDLEPDTMVVELHDAWRTATQRLNDHLEREPKVPDAASSRASPADLRNLAADLEQPIPEVDESLRQQVDELRATPAAGPHAEASTDADRRRLTPGRLAALVVAGILVLGGIGGLGEAPAVGAVVILVGVVGAALAVGLRPRSTARAPDRAPSPAPPPDLPRLEARLAVQEESQSQARARVQRATQRIEELGLPHDPAQLRHEAARIENIDAARSQLAEWQEQRDELTSAVDETKGRLSEALTERGEAASTPPDGLDEAFRRYVESCRDRAETARLAARRPDLEARIETQRAAERERNQRVEDRERAASNLREVATTAGCNDEQIDIDELARALREWLETQKELVKTGQKAERERAALAELLDGHTLEELSDDLDRRKADAGDRPVDLDVELDDKSDELARLEGELRRIDSTIDELKGQLVTAERDLPDVCAAVEALQRAESEVASLEALGDVLNLASQFLQSAKDDVHADIAPILNDTLRPWIARISQGRYDDVRVTPESLAVEAREATGQYRDASVLSHGTTEQLFLLLRLALAEHLGDGPEVAPLVLDDITVQSDTERTLALLDLLKEISHVRQVVLFTQEDEVLAWARDHLDDSNDRLVSLDRR